MDFDERLARGAPPIATRTDDLRADVAALVAEAETRHRPRRRKHRAAVVALAGLLVAGGGVAVAGANGLVTPLFNWGSNTGRQCTSRVQWEAFDDIGGEMMSRDWPYSVQLDTKRAAEVFTSRYDFSKIDRERALVEFRTEERRRHDAAEDPSEMAPRLSDEEAELEAVYGIYFDELHTYLDAQGLPMETITPGISYTCE